MDPNVPGPSRIENETPGTHWTPMGMRQTDEHSESTMSADEMQPGPSTQRARSNSSSSTYSNRYDVDADGQPLRLDAVGVVHRDGYEAYLREGSMLFSTRNIKCYNLPMLNRSLSAKWLRRKIEKIIGNRVRSYYILAGFVVTIEGQPECIFFPSQNTCIYRSFNKYPSDNQLRKGIDSVVRKLLSRSSGVDAILLNLQVVMCK